MKKRNYTLTTALTAALCCLICLLNGCTRDNDIDIPQTSVNTMGATTVQPGETITLTGDNMHHGLRTYGSVRRDKSCFPCCTLQLRSSSRCV